MSTTTPDLNDWNRIAGRAIDTAVTLLLLFLYILAAYTLAPREMTGFIAIISGIAAAAFRLDLHLLRLTGRLKQALGLPAESWSFQLRTAQS